MAKKKDEVVEEATTAPAVEETAVVPKEVKTSFDIYNPGGALVRTYSVETHGEDAEKLASEYAGKISGKVV